MVTEHNYALDNLYISDVRNLDALFLLKETIITCEPSKPVYVVPVTYTKGWTINYVETPIDTYKEIWSLGTKLKYDELDDTLQVFNYKATKDYTEYAVVCNGIMYTFSDENKSYFANVFMRGNSAIISYNTNDDIKTKEEVETAEKRKLERREQTKDHIEKFKTSIKNINLKLATEKLPLHIKYKSDEDYFDCKFMYKDLVEGQLTDVYNCGLNWEELYNKRKVFYTLQISEMRGQGSLNVEHRRPGSGNKDIDEVISEYELYGAGVSECAKLIKILQEEFVKAGLTLRV